MVMSIKKDKAEYQKQLMRRMKRSDKMTEVRDKWRKYIHGVVRTTLKSRAAKEQNENIHYSALSETTVVLLYWFW